MSRIGASSWSRVMAESVRRNRAGGKAVHIWLAIAVAAGSSSADVARIVAHAFQIFAAAISYVLVTILVNDLTDRDDDRAAAKRRPITELPHASAWSLIVLTVLIGVILLLVGGMPRAALTVYAAAILAGLLYSLRPVRLKARGMMGPLCYGLSTCLAYVIMPWAGLNGEWLVPVVLAPAVFFDKWVQLHFHQVVDYDADAASGVRTLAVACGRPRATGTLHRAAWTASLLMVSAGVWVVNGLGQGKTLVAGLLALATIAAAAYVYVARSRTDQPSDLLRLLPAPYLALSYVVFRILPLVLIILAGLEHRRIWALLPLAALTVASEFRYMAQYRYE